MPDDPTEFEREPRLKEAHTPEQLLRIISDYTAKIANERNLHHVLVLMANMGREMILSDRCTVWLIDHKRGELFTIFAHGVVEIRVPIGSGFVGYSIATGQPLLIEDAYKDPRHNAENDRKTGYRTKSVITVPFVGSDGNVIGAYQAINKMTKEGVFTQRDLEYLSLAASYAGKSLESVMLHEEIVATQKEIIFRMGEVGESRSKETGNHVKVRAPREVGRHRLSARPEGRGDPPVRTNHGGGRRVRRARQRPGLQEGLGARPHPHPVPRGARTAFRSAARGCLHGRAAAHPRSA